jgi:dTDP-glucose 4,6-dehydratase
VEAIWAVIERGAVGETYNVGGNQEMRNIDVVDTLCRVVARQTGADEAALLALKTFVTDRPGHDLRYAIDASKIERECGWTPRESFESGIDKTVRWYLANQEWVRAVETGEYRRWIDANYASRSATKEAT